VGPFLEGKFPWLEADQSYPSAVELSEWSCIAS